MLNKIIGVLNFLLGISVIVQAGSFLVFVLPKLNNLYKQIDYNVPVSTYVTSIVMIVLGNACFYLGYTQFTSDKEKYFKYASGMIIAAFIALGLYSALIIPSVIMPIYDLTTQLQ